MVVAALVESPTGAVLMGAGVTLTADNLKRLRDKGVKTIKVREVVAAPPAAAPATAAVVPGSAAIPATGAAVLSPIQRFDRMMATAPSTDVMMALATAARELVIKRKGP